jgi:uncharacterized protein with HEPN domain
MQPKTPKLLRDLCDAAAFILESTRGKTLDDYRADRLLRNAVERNFEIIGEAMKRLAGLDPATAGRIAEYPRIIAFRNVLIHGYDLVDHAQVWGVVVGQVPELHEQLTALLREAPETT